ncbi:hypothetical protein F5Y18DRAFT_434077 [Xylariaceae sp. FL1019]|nr:hypothetical protein F5Y18DRAFT_434077 [Xylariaceae sp. FL1019]
MKTDTYLTLCVEQAELSPLHYRHGCIIVKGGKIIGKGFNDYRPGFDGGALKTGVLPTKAVATDKPSTQDDSKGKNGFKPFDATVGLYSSGHHHATNCLSMHSEMMAINSALALSSAKASTTLSHVKPAITTARDNKRNRQQRRDVLQAYAQRVSYATPGQEVSGTQQQHGSYSKASHQQKGERKKGYYHGVQHHGMQHHAHTSSLKRTTRQHHQEQQPELVNKHNKLSKATHHTKISPGSGSLPSNSNWTSEDRLEMASDNESHSSDTSNSMKNIGKKDRNKHNDQMNESTPELLSYPPSDRKKHPRLRGADVYVVRLGRKVDDSGSDRKKRSGGSSKNSGLLAAKLTAKSKPESAEIDAQMAPTGSLYDELLCKGSKKPTERQGSSSGGVVLDRGHVLESRPCYRCVLYMQSVGIRRCYWSNASGEWESAKVRDLFDQCNGTINAGGQTGAGEVFVTKHEILMLRRLYNVEQ